MKSDKSVEQPCPSCRKSVLWEGNPHRPFCSKRCKMTDLEGWMSGRYRIPGPPVDPHSLDGEKGDEEQD